MLWRSLLIRILVNAAAIALAVIILPGFAVINPWRDSTLLDLLAAGLILAVLNAFVKPVVQILTGRLTIATLGLFGFIIDAIVLGIIIWLSPTRWELDRGLLTLLIAGALIALWSIIKNRLESGETVCESNTLPG